MNFVTAVRTCFSKYATFKGTASRPEYWYFFLFNIVISLILTLIGVRALSGIWSLATLLPGLAVAVRRLHDTNKSGWWFFTFIIPPWLIVLLCLPPVTVNNRYADGAQSVTEAHLSSSTASCPTCGKLRLPGQAFCTGCGAKFADS